MRLGRPDLHRLAYSRRKSLSDRQKEHCNLNVWRWSLEPKRLVVKTKPHALESYLKMEARPLHPWVLHGMAPAPGPVSGCHKRTTVPDFFLSVSTPRAPGEELGYSSVNWSWHRWKSWTTSTYEAHPLKGKHRKVFLFLVGFWCCSSRQDRYRYLSLVG